MTDKQPAAIVSFFDMPDGTVMTEVDMCGEYKGTDAQKDAAQYQGWISINDRFPEDNQRVLCWEDFTFIGKQWQGAEVYYYRKHFGFVHLPEDEDGYGGITHWMPIPPQPCE